MQEKYGFRARTYQAAGFANVAEYKKVHSSDLFIRDIEEYDKICKVSFSVPLQSLTMASLHLDHIMWALCLCTHADGDIHMLLSFFKFIVVATRSQRP